MPSISVAGLVGVPRNHLDVLQGAVGKGRSQKLTPTFKKKRIDLYPTLIVPKYVFLSEVSVAEVEGGRGGGGGEAVLVATTSKGGTRGWWKVSSCPQSR